MNNFLRLIAILLPRFSRKGGAMVEYAMVVGLVASMAVVALFAVGTKTDEVLCMAGNGMRQVSGDMDERCPIALMDDGTTTGIGPQGFEDLYLALNEVKPRRVLLPVKGFDISGMDEVIVETNRIDSVAACYELAGGQVTCASYLGFISAFDFPPNVVAVGYEFRPVADVRVEMAQPIAITLGSRVDPSVNQTWNIFAYRPAVPNVFEPEFNFDDHEFFAGQVGEQNIIKELTGRFDPDDLLLQITPTEGAFGVCVHEKMKEDPTCGLIQADTSSTLVKTDAKSLGYQLYLPRDVRVPVSWPLTVSLASTFDPENDVKTWDVTVSRPVGEAPAFPDLPFADTEFAPATTGWDYAMLPLDQAYPSDLIMRVSQSDGGLMACYQEVEDGDYICSPDAGAGDASVVVPAGSYAVGLGVRLPDDVLAEFDRRAAFHISSVVYTDFASDYDIALTRPSFASVFEPTFEFADHAFSQGTTDWQSHLVALTGTFNSDLTLVLPAGQSGVQLCVQATPEGVPACSIEGGTKEVLLDVPQDSYAIGFALNLGESEFQPVSQEIAFALRSALDPRSTQDYALIASRPASEIVFEPDAAAMTFADMAYAEATEGWQSAQMVALAGTYNTDLLLSMPGTDIDAAVCYALAGGAEPVCSETALGAGQSLVVPNEASHIGFKVQMSENIYIEQDLAIAFTLGSAETDTYSVPLTSRATRPAVPVKFDPSLGFRDKTFAAGKRGTQNVMVPIEGEITTGLQITMPAVDFSLRACFIDIDGAAAACSSNARNGEAVLDVPRGAVAVGYQVELPEDIHVDWSGDVSFDVGSDADETLSYQIAISASRETTPVSFAPTTVFENISFEAGTVGEQDVIQALTGDITTAARVRITAGGHPIAACIEKSVGSPPSCADDAVSSDSVATVVWSTEEYEAGKRASGAGYRVTMPENIYEAVDWTVSLRLESTYNAATGRTYDIRITRPAVPVIWAPKASMKLPDADFPARATGERNLMVPFAGEFTTSTDYTIASTGSAIYPCFREIATGAIECGASTESGSASVSISPGWEAIGYRIDLPSDLAQEVEKTVYVDLRSAYDPTLSQTQSFRVYRAPAPVIFDPTVAFSSRSFTNGETGWQTIMEPLTGDLTTALELVSDGDTQMRLCVRDTAADNLRCTSGSSGAQTLSVPPTAHAIGVAVSLPEDPRIENNQTLPFNLRMADYPSQARSYSVAASRPALDLDFSTAMTFASETLAVSESGWKTFMTPLEGNFSTDIEWIATTPASYLKLCSQATAGGDITCGPAGGANLPVNTGLYAIGYAVEIPDTEFEAFGEVANLRLQSAEARTIGKDFAPAISRPALKVILPASTLFQNHTFAAETSGSQTVMKTLDGFGNTPMTFNLAKSSMNIRACLQKNAGGVIECKSTSAAQGAQSYDIDATTYAVGYKVVLPEEPFAVISERVDLAIVSKTVQSEYRNYAITVSRTVKTPVMPANDLFVNKAYNPGETGERTVMAVLDPKIDTRLNLRKGSYQPDIEICVQYSPSGAPTCVGAGNHGAIGVNDVDRSWYAVGYRLSLDEDPDPEFFKTIKISLHSLDVTSASTSYNIGVSRLKMNAIMPDRTFFMDEVFAEGESGSETVLKPLGETDIGLVLHKAAGQEGLELCAQVKEGGDTNCSSSNSITIDSSWHAIGYRFDLGNEFQSLDRDIVLSLTARDGWSNRVNYAVNLSKPATPITMPGEDLFHDITLAAGDTSARSDEFDFTGRVNASVTMKVRNTGPNVSVCNSNTSSRTCSYAFNDDDMVTISKSHKTLYMFIGTSALNKPYVDLDETIEIDFISTVDPTVTSTHTVRITRPALEVDMPDESVFHDLVFAAGDTTARMEEFPFAGQINASVTMKVRNTGPYVTLCNTTTSSRRCSSANLDDEGVTIAQSQQALYLYVNSSVLNEPFKELDETIEIDFVSEADPSVTSSHTVRITRPALELTMPDQDLFHDLVFAAGDTAARMEEFPFAGQINQSVTMKVRNTGPYVALCNTTTSSRKCSRADQEDTDVLLTESQQSLFMYVNASVLNEPFKELDETIEIDFVSAADPSVTSSHTVRITRPAQEITLPNQDLFHDIVFAAGDTTSLTEVFSYAGQSNVPVVITARNTGQYVSICNNLGNYRTCTRADQDDAGVPIPASQQAIPMIVSSTFLNKPYEELDETIEIEIVLQADPSVSSLHTVRITRPALEITLPPEGAFPDFAIAQGTTSDSFKTIDLPEALTTDMIVELSNENFYFGVCASAAWSTNCSTARSSTASYTLPAGSTRLHYVVYRSGLSNTFENIDKTVQVTLKSSKDSNRFVTYDVNITRPGSEITLPPAGALPDFEIAQGTTSDTFKQVVLPEALSTDMIVEMSAENFYFGVCNTTTINGYCSLAVSGTSAYTLTAGKTAFYYGVKSTELSDKFKSIDQTVQVTFRSKTDASRSITYDVRITRPGAEITLPSANTLPDFEIVEAKTNDASSFINLPEAFSTDMIVEVSKEDFRFGVCSRTTYDSYCSQAFTGSSTYTLEAGRKSFYYMVDKYELSNKFISIDRTVQVTLRSKYDASRFVTYDVRITRPGVEITLPKADAFPDVAFPEGQTSSTYKIVTLDEAMNTPMTIEVGATGRNVGICPSYGYDARYCSVSLTGSSNYELKAGYRTVYVHILGNEISNKFEEFDVTIPVTLRSTEDSSKFVSYNVRVHRPAVEIERAQSDALPSEIVFAAGQTNNQYKMVSLSSYLNTAMKVEVENAGNYIALCGGTSFDARNCSIAYGDANNYTIPSGVRNFYIHLLSIDPDNKNPTVGYSKPVNLTLRSVENSDVFTDYEVQIIRPASN